jgi:hypothetical protein
MWAKKKRNVCKPKFKFSSGILSVPPPSLGGRQREERKNGHLPWPLAAPGQVQNGLEVEEDAPCSASVESARPNEARFLAAGFRVIQVW